MRRHKRALPRCLPEPDWKQLLDRVRTIHMSSTACNWMQPYIDHCLTLMHISNLASCKREVFESKGRSDVREWKNFLASICKDQEPCNACCVWVLYHPISVLLLKVAHRWNNWRFPIRNFDRMRRVASFVVGCSHDVPIHEIHMQIWKTSMDTWVQSP